MTRREWHENALACAGMTQRESDDPLTPAWTVANWTINKEVAA